MSPSTHSEALSRLSKLAAALLDAPIAHVTLVTDGRQHYAGAHGLPPEVLAQDEVPLTFGFCPTVVATDQPLYRPDLRESEFRDNPAVLEHGARAYAGTPLRASGGRVIGSFCVVDVVPRVWSQERLDLLGQLAEGVMTELELAAALRATSAALAEAERLRAASQERADAARVLEHISEGVVLLDQHGMVRVWNPAAAAMTGIAPAEALGSNIRELFEAWPASGTGTIATIAEDHERTILVTGVSWGEGSVHAMRDISDEHRLTRMRDELIATMSHELRTPLSAIYAASITLQREDIELETPTATSLLALVEEQASRLTKLADEILLASRLDRGLEPASLEPVRLSSVIDGAVDDLTAQPELFRRLVIDADEQAVAHGDAAHLRQVLRNLLDNAFKYSSHDQPVKVTARRLPGDLAELVVEDQGRGIPPLDRRNVFQKFYRCDPDMRHGVGGTGLGLFICRELVDAMGGRVFIAPTSGGDGTRFHVELPATAPVVSRNGAAAACDGQPRVLPTA